VNPSSEEVRGVVTLWDWSSALKEILLLKGRPFRVLYHDVGGQNTTKPQSHQAAEGVWSRILASNLQLSHVECGLMVIRICYTDTQIQEGSWKLI